jgi:hypothetical protein
MQKNDMPEGGTSPLLDQWGYFQLAGIHGDPTVDWGGVKGTTFYDILRAQGRQEIQNSLADNPKKTWTEGDLNKGYCPHGSIQL